ncbi:hypothetical protein NDU88_000330 [Pleurodeles waltl]|uniref:Uncharacterized protein n=1 Tax=Pleurodeles waltl TaxID=8319 RepID=A0AAV7S6N4_PLEWA|nr:hypothetical protein NDU88_000330 [Pleurodeles waltl]
MRQLAHTGAPGIKSWHLRRKPTTGVSSGEQLVDGKTANRATAEHRSRAGTTSPPGSAPQFLDLAIARYLFDNPLSFP